MKRKNRSTLDARESTMVHYVEKFLRRGLSKGRDEGRKDETKRKTVSHKRK